jgi:hypothetical protein
MPSSRTQTRSVSSGGNRVGVLVPPSSNRSVHSCFGVLMRFMRILTMVVLGRVTSLGTRLVAGSAYTETW